MARASKCDVCGTLYQGLNPHDITIRRYRHPYGTETVDLCPECQKKLEAFVNGDKKALNKKENKNEQSQ